MKSLEAQNLKDKVMKMQPQFSLSVRNARNGAVKGYYEQNHINTNDFSILNYMKVKE